LPELLRTLLATDAALLSAVDRYDDYDSYSSYANPEPCSNEAGSSTEAPQCSEYAASHALVVRLKAAIWALAQIGASDPGFVAVAAAASTLAGEPQISGGDVSGSGDAPGWQGGEGRSSRTADTLLRPQNDEESGDCRSEEKEGHATKGVVEEMGGATPASGAAFSFTDWCVTAAGDHPHYSVRATAFAALGLLSRCTAGRLRLSQRGWDSSLAGCCSAVALSRSRSFMFGRDVHEEGAALRVRSGWFRRFAASPPPLPPTSSIAWGANLNPSPLAVHPHPPDPRAVPCASPYQRR
jgi:hypothetical protein